MQWILEYQSLILSSLCAATLSGVAVGWWVKQRFITQTQLLEQQLVSEKQLHQQQQQQLWTTQEEEAVGKAMTS